MQYSFVSDRLRTLVNQQLMNEAEADNTLRDLHNSSYDRKAVINNCLIIHSK